VARVERARWLVWAGIGLVLALRFAPAAPLPPLGFVSSAGGGCALAPSGAGAAAPCACTSLPAHARRVLGLPISLNAAAPHELEWLPGIGPARASAIARDRAARGPFESVAALARVDGIGPVSVDALRPHLFARGPDPACSRSALPLHDR
jgi:competence protein ComEA